MSYREGQTVTSIGDGHDGVPLGTHGKILVLASAGSGHVQWVSGPLSGQVSFVPRLADAVAPASRQVQAAYARRDGLEDSLEVGPITTTGAAHLMNISGPQGVLSSLHSTGALAEAGDVAEEALALVEHRLRQTVAVQTQLAELDEEDRAEVLRLASQSVLTQSYGAGDGD